VLPTDTVNPYAQTTPVSPHHIRTPCTCLVARKEVHGLVRILPNGILSQWQQCYDVFLELQTGNRLHGTQYGPRSAHVKVHCLDEVGRLEVESASVEGNALAAWADCNVRYP
jgi:hypothetical protein